VDVTEAGRAIEVRDLVVVRGGRAVLDGVCLGVAAGTVTGLLGPSGAGKTTLMRAVVGVQRVRSGQVNVLGRPAGSAELRSRIGYLTQAPAVYGDLTVAENLRYFAAVTGAGDRRITAAGLADLVESLRIGDLTGRVVDRLSGGQRARVSLAVALVGDPEILVLDEPTVGLDPLLRRDMWHLFHRLAAAGRTLLVSTHVMDEARRCTDLLLLHDGRLLAAGPPGEIAGSARADAVEDAFVRLVEAHRHTVRAEREEVAR
jgi:ABC-2 type transport system ATP-binding protein